ncbi:unnamed protein product [Lymnaea stagnalis]|uniref:C-type lectin domain-containing protein n=1 Tax=Lymnaea stagnalis TaxID=6523 RepID=A0AAV2H3Q8_LYMST
MNMNIWAFVSFFVVTRAALQIEVNPAKVQLGVTKDLQVRCTFTAGKIPTITRLFYLLISHSNATTEEPDFQYLALINLFDGQINVFSQEFTSANGYINTRGESFIAVVWKDPKSTTAGAYRCDANGVDFIGRPRTLSETATVEAASPGVDVFLKEMANLTSHLAHLERTVSEFREQTANLRLFQDTMKSRLALVLKSMFDESEVFMGRRYYLSKDVTSFAPSTGGAACAMFGGYLAEIESNDEFQFLREFIIVSNRNMSVVMTGATDANEEGHWILSQSRADLEVFNWAEGEPDEGTHANCQGFSRDGDWYMADTSCVKHSPANDVGYICEIPESMTNG